MESSVVPHQFDFYIIDSMEMFDRLVAYEAAVESDILAIDLETNSQHERLAKTWGIGLGWTKYKSFYVVLKDKHGNNVFTDDQQKIIINFINTAVSKRKLIGHNAIYDILVYKYCFQLDITQYLHSDTILLKHSIDENRPFGLKEISVQYLGAWADKAQEKLKQSVLANGGKWNDDQKDMYLAETSILAEYCCFDILLTIMLYEKFNPMIDEQGLRQLFEEETMPLYREVTIPMKDKGFPIDVEYFKQLNQELETEITTLQDNIMNQVRSKVSDFEQDLLDKNYPVKAAGNFPKSFANVLNIPLPKKKDGKVTLAAKELEKMAQANTDPYAKVFYDWLITKSDQPTNGWIYNNRRKVQENLYFADKANEGKRFIFNLASGDHLGYLLYDVLKIEATKFTEKGKPSTKAEVLDELIETYKEDQPWMSLLFDLRKLSKIKSTYVEGILERQLDGVIYTSMLQFGTTSGRFSSTNPNLQNLPRVKDDDSGLSELVLKYANAIRAGLIAGKGHKLVDADYSQLEPCCFATASGDPKLQRVFHQGLDLYSQIAIDVEGLSNYSADKKASNYLALFEKQMRQDYKAIALAIPYGSEEAQVGKLLGGATWEEASEVIRNYLNTYPDLKKYMNLCNYQAKKYGQVKSMFGRIRHLPRAQEIYSVYGDSILDPRVAKRRGLSDVRREFKNLLNNAKNFPIQALAGHIINRAMIAINRRLKAEGIDAVIVLMIHDQVVTLAKEQDAERVKVIMEECMQNTTKIAVPLVAKPQIADNLKDSH